MSEDRWPKLIYQWQPLVRRIRIRRWRPQRTWEIEIREQWLRGIIDCKMCRIEGIGVLAQADCMHCTIIWKEKFINPEKYEREKGCVELT